MRCFTAPGMATRTAVAKPPAHTVVARSPVSHSLYLFVRLAGVQASAEPLKMMLILGSTHVGSIGSGACGEREDAAVPGGDPGAAAREPCRRSAPAADRSGAGEFPDGAGPDRDAGFERLHAVRGSELSAAGLPDFF